MKGLPVQGAVWALWALVLVGFCCCNDESLLVVVGVGECVDCAQKSIKSSDAFSGISMFQEKNKPNHIIIVFLDLTALNFDNFWKIVFFFFFG